MGVIGPSEEVTKEKFVWKISGGSCPGINWTWGKWVVDGKVVLGLVGQGANKSGCQRLDMKMG